MNPNAKFTTGMLLTLGTLLAIWVADRRLCRKGGDGINLLQPQLKGSWTAFALMAAAYTVYTLFSPHKVTPYNNYAWLADAWLHGRLDVPDLPAYLESVQFGGKTYVHFAPGPALLCLPFVAIYGLNGFDAAFLCRLLGAANVVLCWHVLSLRRLGNAYTRLWMTALLGFGTVHFWCASWGSSWLLGHVSTLFFLLLALCFLFQNPLRLRHCFLSGLFFGLAVSCRLSALFGGVFFAGYLLLTEKKKARALLCLAGGAAVFGSMYMLYNAVRFGTVMDMSYSLTYLKDYHREVYDTLQQVSPEQQLSALRACAREYGGPLQAGFIGFNLYSLLAMPPRFQAAFPWVIPTMAGVALTIVSPALLLAVLCPWKKPHALLLWITVVLTAVPFLLNYGNGQAQFGMRYAMDFTPYLFLLACMGMEKLSGWKKGLVLWSILCNAWGALYWACFC